MRTLPAVVGIGKREPNAHRQHSAIPAVVTVGGCAQVVPVGLLGGSVLRRVSSDKRQWLRPLILLGLTAVPYLAPLRLA